MSETTKPMTQSKINWTSIFVAVLGTVQQVQAGTVETIADTQGAMLALAGIFIFIFRNWFSTKPLKGVLK